MKNYIIILICLVILTGCITTKGVQNETVKEAINLQTNAISDPLFSKIMKELEESGDIDWQTGSMNSVEEDLTKYESKIDWLLSKYKADKVYDENSVFLWRKWNPLSSTTAVTSTCNNSTKLNKWRLKRDKYSILNTLIHERVHSFCLTHPDTQTREANKCDASYLAGDLTEVILLYRSGKKERLMNKPMCPELEKKIKEYGFITLL
jgi:hypothetical protein